MLSDCSEDAPLAPSPEWPLEESRAGTGLRQLVGHWRERPAQNEAADAYEYCEPALHAPRRWGLSAEAVAHLGDRLCQFWRRFRGCFTTRTRDTSERAYDDLRAQLTMDTERNFANMDRTLNGGDGQALQHFMSNSPWSGPAVFEQMQAEIKATPALAQGSTLILDESADEKAGMHNVGASRQYNGRLGKVDVCRVDTCLTYANGGLWAMVDGELFLPEEWFGAAFAQTRHALGIPPDRTFETKLQLGLKMVKRVKAKGVPCDLLACDALYGRDSQCRADLAAANIQYAAQVPADTAVYLSEPRVGLPPKRGKRGRPRTRLQVLSSQRPQEVRALAQHPQTVWERVQVRLTERGWLTADFAVRRVWTVAAGQRPRIEWLVMRRNSDGDCSYTLLNAPTDTPQACLIAGSCRRYFTERTFEDAKTEIGWDEFQVQKYRAWEHHLALTAAALWFVAQTKLVWAQMYTCDPALAYQLEVEVLPALSTANVRELLKAVLPLRQLTPAEAMDLVITHLINRARSTSSRLKSQAKPHDSS
jgi:SRSO17 transposase